MITVRRLGRYVGWESHTGVTLRCGGRRRAPSESSINSVPTPDVASTGTHEGNGDTWLDWSKDASRSSPAPGAASAASTRSASPATAPRSSSTTSAATSTAPAATLSPGPAGGRRDQGHGRRGVANGDNVADWEGAQRLINTAIETFGDLHVAGQQRRHPARPGARQHDRGGVGRRHQRPPQGHVRPVAVGRRLLARAGQGRQAGQRPDHQHHVGVGHLRQPGPDATTARPRPASPSFTNIAALEVARYGVTVNAVAPVALTRMTEGLGPAPETDEEREARAPHWIAPIVTWLASEESAGVTGRVFEASGQMLAVAEGWRARPVDRPRSTTRPQLGPIVADLLAKARGELRHGRPHRLLAPDHPDARPPRTRELLAYPRAQEVHENGSRRTDRRQITRRNPMPLNPDAVGSKSEPVETSWTSKDAPALRRRHRCRRATSWRSPPRTPNGVDQLVFPTFPVVIGWGRRLGDGQDRHVQPGAARARPAGGHAAPADPRRRHGHDHERDHRHVRQGQGGGRGRPSRGRRWTASRCTRTRMSAFIRGEGGWGGDRGPSGPQNVPPERDPDHEVTYQTSPDQAFVYRLIGDRNPLHTDPSFAAMGGFDRPILHGLCSYGFTGRALLHSLCGSDPARFHHIEARFAVAGDARRGADDPACGRSATARRCSRRAPSTPPIRRPTAS